MNITFEIYKPEQWDRLKEQFMAIEKELFSGNLLFTEEELKKQVEDFLTIMVFDGDKMVGNTYLSKMDALTTEDFDGYFDPAPYSVACDTLYVNSTALLPDYQRKGIGKKLKYATHIIAASMGYSKIMGHAHSGYMINMLLNTFKASVVKIFDKWYDEDQTNYLYLYEINEAGAFFPRRTQSDDTNCGPTSAYILLRTKGLKPEEIEVALSKLDYNEERGTKALSFAEMEIGDKDISVSRNVPISVVGMLARSGKICVVNYQDEGEAHFSILYGSGKGHVALYNVADGREYIYTTDEFNDIWWSEMNGKKILIY